MQRKIKKLTEHFKSIQHCPLGVGMLEYELKKMMMDIYYQKTYLEEYHKETGNQIPKLINDIPTTHCSRIALSITEACNKKQIEDFQKPKNQIAFLQFCIWWMEQYNKGSF